MKKKKKGQGGSKRASLEPPTIFLPFSNHKNLIDALKYAESNVKILQYKYLE